MERKEKGERKKERERKQERERERGYCKNELVCRRRQMRGNGKMHFLGGNALAVTYHRIFNFGRKLYMPLLLLG